MRAWLSLILLLLLSACDRGPPIPETDCGLTSDAGAGSLCSELEWIRRRYALPSLAAAVWVDDELVAEGAVGVRRVGSEPPVTTADLWHLGSDTKAMTATVAGRLVEAQRLTFDAPLAVLFPGVDVHPLYRDVTLRQVLMHRSGTARDPRRALWERMVRDRRSSEVRQEVVAQILVAGPSEPVGEFLYSNAGYMIAGAALERATSMTWESLMQTQLFEPLGMGSCGFGAPATPGTVDQPWGHLDQRRFVPVKPGPRADNPPSMGPAGTVHCSLRDWAKFLSVHLKGARAEPAPFLSPQTLVELQTAPANGDYALGWGVVTRDWAEERALTHSGSNGMFFATVWLAPAKNAILVAVSNAGSEPAQRAVNEAFAPMLELILP